MRITKVTYRTMTKGPRFAIGACVIVLEDSLMLHDVLIMESSTGRYIVMPGRRTSGTVRGSNKHSDDVFHPVSSSFHEYMKDTVLVGFKEYEADKNRYMYFPSR